MAGKPLHVQVAEALGWTWRKAPLGQCRMIVAPQDHSFDHWPIAVGDEPICQDGYRNLPRYDTDWSATGPLIERYLPQIIIHAYDRCEPPAPGKRQAFVPGDPAEGWGETTPEAICRLLLALHAAGKLNTSA